MQSYQFDLQSLYESILLLTKKTNRGKLKTKFVTWKIKNTILDILKKIKILEFR